MWSGFQHDLCFILLKCSIYICVKKAEKVYPLSTISSLSHTHECTQASGTVVLSGLWLTWQMCCGAVLWQYIPTWSHAEARRLFPFNAPSLHQSSPNSEAAILLSNTKKKKKKLKTKSQMSLSSLCPSFFIIITIIDVIKVIYLQVGLTFCYLKVPFVRKVDYWVSFPNCQNMKRWDIGQVVGNEINVCVLPPSLLSTPVVMPQSGCSKAAAAAVYTASRLQSPAQVPCHFISSQENYRAESRFHGCQQLPEWPSQSSHIRSYQFWV